MVSYLTFKLVIDASKTLLFLIGILVHLSQTEAARNLNIKFVIVNDPERKLTSTFKHEEFKIMVDYANKVYAGNGNQTVQFNFDPSSDVLYVSDKYIANEFELAADEHLGQAYSKYKHRINIKKYIEAKNNFAKKYPKSIVVFSAPENQIYWENNKFVIKERNYAYSNHVDHFVAMTGFNTSKISLFAHEVGHYLGLDHTLGYSPLNAKEMNEIISNYLDEGGKVDSILSLFDGDSNRVSDTPSDPGPEFWKFATGDACGPQETYTHSFMYNKNSYQVKFSPDRYNIMSYFDGCLWAKGYHLSAKQSDIVHQIIQNGLRQKLWSNANEDTSLLAYYNSEFDVTSWGSGRMDLTVLGALGDVKTIAYEAANGFYPMSTDADVVMDFPNIQWYSLAQNAQYPPAIQSLFPGHISIFAIYNNQLLHKLFIDGQWAPWKVIGGSSYIGKPALVQIDKYKMAIVVRSTNGRLYLHSYVNHQISQNPIDLGGKFSSDPVVISFTKDRFDIFVKGVDKKLYHNFVINGVVNQTWENLGGQILGKPAVTSWGNNRIDLVVRGTDQRIYHKAWTGQNWYPSIDGWSLLGGEVSTTTPSIASYKINGLIVSTNLNGVLAYKYWNGQAWIPAGLAWQKDLTQNINPEYPTKVFALDGSWHIFGRGLSGDVWHKQQKENSIMRSWSMIGRYF